ncbi:MAG: carboxypeptidase-like regulatory domain-containing protein [Ignavibacteriota bacterium]
MKQTLLSFCVLVLIAVVSGCTSTNSSNPNSTTSLNGSITGTVSLGRELGSSPNTFSSSAGVTVSLDGTSLSATTDSSGFWKLDNVPSGNYDVTITKSGFGLTRNYGVAISGPGTTYIPRIYLGELPSQAPELISANVATINWTDTGKQKQRVELQVQWKTPYDRSYSDICIFLDKNNTVQPADVHFYTTLSSTTGGNLQQEWLGFSWGDSRDPILHSTEFEGVVACPIETLHAHGIASGTTIYVSLSQYDPYGINGVAPNNKATYYDPVNNQNRIISPSPRSNVVAVTIP